LDRCRVLLVDDNQEFLKILARLLAAYPEVDVVGSARSGREALDQVALLHPDLVLVDLVMPDMDGLETTRRIKARPVSPRVILMTMQEDAEYREAAQEAGADGFIPKPDLGAQFVPAARTICEGRKDTKTDTR
jgi:DNA-binding NarL/FixJ family response regulator